VIEGDAFLGGALTRALQSKGFVVEHAREARDGFRRVCDGPWDCLVCSPDLPDIDGLWVARRVRTENGPIAKVPILFFGEMAEASVRSQALSIGVDVFLAQPPASIDDVCAQVGALIAMARRLDPDDEAPPSVSNSAALRGDLSAFPLASLLMMFEMERRSGTVQVVAQSGKRCVLTITSGLFASTESAGVQRPPLEVLREVLSWRVGRFSFHPKESGTLPEPMGSVGALVLEAMRLEDEEKGPLPELDSMDLVDADTKAGKDRRVLPDVGAEKEKRKVPIPPRPPKVKAAR
jgi:CheY-like chemotaxis protein